MHPYMAGRALVPNQLDGWRTRMPMSQIDRSSTFWSAFVSGLASPAGLYAAPVDYARLARVPTVAQSFAAVGAAMRCAYAQQHDERDTRKHHKSAA